MKRKDATPIVHVSQKSSGIVRAYMQVFVDKKTKTMPSYVRTKRGRSLQSTSKRVVQPKGSPGLLLTTVKIDQVGSITFSHTKHQQNLAILSAINDRLTNIIHQIVAYLMDAGKNH